MNAFVLRHISRDVLGLINVRLNLLDDTIMFLSKECFRLACLSHTTGREWGDPPIAQPSRVQGLKMGDVLLHSPCLYHKSPIIEGPRVVGFLCPTYMPASARRGGH